MLGVIAVFKNKKVLGYCGTKKPLAQTENRLLANPTTLI
jgi:hypothetical protein